MAQVSTGGTVSIDSDAASASGALMNFGYTAGSIVNIKGVYVSPISTASGVQSGLLELRQGVAVIARWYAFFTASAANQSDTFYFPCDITIKPAGLTRLVYTAVTDATTAAISVIWN